MSQSHEPSYYEIALTNRQVLVVFVVLLVCIVAAFFSGVWVGQKDSLPVPGPALAEADSGPRDSRPRSEYDSTVPTHSLSGAEKYFMPRSDAQA